MQDVGTHVTPTPFSVRAFCDGVRRAPRKERSRSLDQIRDLVAHVIVSPFSLARVFGSPELDALCQELGSRGAPKPARERSDRTVFLVTSLAPIGGHSRLLLDVIRASGESGALVLASDILDEGLGDAVCELLAGVDATYEAGPKGNLDAKLRWLQSRLAEVKPARTITLLHPFDSVSIAALQPGLGGAVTFVHNFDHNLALGVHLPHAKHADLHCKGLFDCRDLEGLTNNVLWPLVVEDPGAPSQRTFMADGAPFTSTAGGFEKFERFFVQGIHPHLNGYLRVLPRMMLAGGGRHLHVGPLPADFLNSLWLRFAEVGVPRERFIHEPYASDLGATLTEHKVDVYVGSFPIGGGRATLEAMAAGLPLIIHDNYQSAHLSVVDEVYPGAMIWRTPEDLEKQVAGLTPRKLKQHSAEARACYESAHRPELLERAIHGRPLKANRLVHPVDRLQTHFDLETTIAHAVASGTFPWSHRTG